MGENANVVTEQFDLSGLSRAPDSAALHQDHQVRGGAGPGTTLVRVVDASNTVAFGQSNIFQLPALDMVVDEVYLSMDVRTITATTAGYLMPTYWWLGSQGAQLLAKGTSVYVQQEALTRDYKKMNTESSAVLNTFLDETNDIGAVGGLIKGVKNAQYLLDLSPMVDAVLNKAGTISAYPSNFWSFDINLKSFNQVVASETGSTAATGGVISNARLILIGHKEEAGVISNQTRALANDGIRIVYSQPNYFRFNITSGDTSAVYNMPSIQGNVSHVWHVVRAVLGLDSTTPLTVNDSPLLSILTTDTLRVGTAENPDLLWGRALRQDTVRFLIQGKSYLGSSEYHNPVVASTLPYKSGLMAVALCEKGSSDLMFGVFSGAMRVNNNFQLNSAFANPGADQRVRMIVFIRRVLNLGLNGINAILNEE